MTGLSCPFGISITGPINGSQRRVFQARDIWFLGSRRRRCVGSFTGGLRVATCCEWPGLSGAPGAAGCGSFGAGCVGSFPPSPALPCRRAPTRVEPRALPRCSGLTALLLAPPRRLFLAGFLQTGADPRCHRGYDPEYSRASPEVLRLQTLSC